MSTLTATGPLTLAERRDEASRGFAPYLNRYDAVDVAAKKAIDAYLETEDQLAERRDALVKDIAGSSWDYAGLDPTFQGITDHIIEMEDKREAAK